MARREPARGSWFAAVLGLGVLACIAFFVGAVTGLVWKEPGLLLAYLRGDTAEIAWSTASSELVAAEPPRGSVSSELEPADAPASVTKTVPERKVAAVKPAPPPQNVAKPAPPPQNVAKPAPPPQNVAESAPPKPLPAVAAAPPAHIAVQVGAFSERAVAEKLRLRLDAAGFPAYLATDARTDEHWRVRVGPYAARPEAEKAADRLARGQKLPTWILDEDAE